MPQVSLFDEPGVRPPPGVAPAQPAEAPRATRKATAEERLFGSAAWLWVPGPGLFVHWDIRKGYRLPDGTAWRAPKRLEPSWWAPVTAAPASQAAAAITATEDRRCRYYFHPRGWSIHFGDPEAEPPADDGRFGHWSAGLDGTGWAELEGRRVLVLAALSVESVGLPRHQRASLIQFTEGGEAAWAWAKPVLIQDKVQQAATWDEVADDLAFLAARPELPVFREDAIRGWENLRAAVPAYTDAGLEDAIWRVENSAGRILLHHKPSAQHVALPAPADGLPRDLHRFIRHLHHEATAAPASGSRIYVRDADAMQVDGYFDRLEAALAWCKDPTPDAWRLVGLRLGHQYGVRRDQWEDAFELLDDLAGLHPEPGSRLHAAMERGQRVLRAAEWNVPAILAVRDQRMLNAAAQFQPKKRTRPRPAQGADDSEE